MSYIINKYNGTQLLVLEDGTIDTTTSLGLVGRNYVGYGETQNENFVFLLENFANDLPPFGPIEGQTWYNTSTNLFNVYDGASWKPVGASIVSDTAPSDPVEGSLWFKDTTSQLYIYFSSRWWLIGPEAVEGAETTKAEAASIIDVDGISNPVILYKVNGGVVSISSSRAFTIGQSNPLPGFSQISVGLTISSLAEVRGYLNGLADRATRLENLRTINGIGFDGTSDIIITSNTTKKLLKGDYIAGTDFNGSTETTWSVDASSSNIIGKVVARDSNGNFSAGTITANLTGDVKGNINISTGTSKFNIVEATAFIGESLSGNAFSASKLKTPRNINGVAFDGSADVTVPAAAATLTGNTINATVYYSSLKSVGLLNDLRVSNAGAVIGDNNELKISIEGSKPVIKTQINNQEINFQVLDSTYSDPNPTVGLLSSIASRNASGPTTPAFTKVSFGDINLGLPDKRWNKVYSNSLISTSLDVSTISSSTSNTITANANVVITGNLSVEGSLTAINSTEVTIEDKTLTLAAGAATPEIASGSGIIIDGTNTDSPSLNDNASMIYSSVGAKWVFNRTVDAGSYDFTTTGYFRGIATSAQYADLAENYVADKNYEPGTVLGLGGEAEVTIVDDFSKKVIGIVSTDPAYLMNSACKGNNVVAIALQGRVPCKVTGKIKRGDMLVSAGSGFARAEENPVMGTVVGKALEDFDGTSGIIEVIVNKI